jgi:hypothetical protein
MTNKITLAKCESRGNLIDPSLKQTYLIQFYPPVIEDGKVVLCEKGIIEICAPSSSGESVVKSYRMVDPSQEYLFIIDLIKLYFFHKRFKGELNEFTLNAFLNKLLKDTKNEGIKVLEGVYDNGI